MMSQKRRKKDLGLLLGALLCFGLGIGFFLYGRTQRVEPEAPAAPDKMASSTDKIAQAMQYVQIEKEIHFDTPKAAGEARIENQKENVMSAALTVIRDADCSVVYASDLIDPGHYIEQIYLKEPLKAGESYPCTAIWKFYEQADDTYIGEGAVKTILIIQNGGE